MRDRLKASRKNRNGSGLPTELIKMLAPHLVALIPALATKSVTEIGDFIARKLKGKLGNGFNIENLSGLGYQLSGGGNHLMQASGTRLPGMGKPELGDYPNGMMLQPYPKVIKKKMKK